MEEFLLHHCVTSEVAKSADNEKPQASTSVWQTSGRAECVLVQENRQAHGSSRVILSAMLKLVLQSAKTTNVLLLTLDIGSVEAKVELKGVTSARPLVVVLDSLNALLQQTSLQQVLLFFRRLREHALVGSVIARLNAGAESPAAAQALAAQATALVLVETRSSLRSYPLLAKERRREIPKEMHGLVLLVRQKKNGRSSESLEYFQMLPDKVHVAEQRAKSQVQLPYMHQGSGGVSSGPSRNDVDSKKWQHCSCCWQHTLFFVDEDDPDWDDDDLDDDLDI
ncbi:hypothetical protein GQ600_6008 [Phytophthora cactorum]|nr:hypothetical protein GQ600_6008 [Phytophthora cactorum]